jgi:hypothetical protein
MKMVTGLEKLKKKDKISNSFISSIKNYYRLNEVYLKEQDLL